MTWFWQEGNGSHAVFGIAATGAMTFWLPPLIFAFLFGLSMDYEVFILTRMREEYDRSGDHPGRRSSGIGRTGRLVTSAALILFFAFAALASAPGTDIKVFATAWASASSSTRRSSAPLLVPSLVVAVRPVELVAAGVGRQDHAGRAARRHRRDRRRRPRAGARARGLGARAGRRRTPIALAWVR